MGFEFTVNANTIIGFVGLLTAVGVLFGLIKNYVHQIDKWNGYDKQIEEVKNSVDTKTSETNDKIKDLKQEQKMQTKVLLAVLDGLHQQGCNGKVTQATKELTDYLNEKSHE